MRAFDDTTHARTVSPMTPDLFHQSAALVLASTAIARRLVLRMFYGDVFPNLFVLWLAVTTLWRKTTALDVARKIARAVFPHLLFAQETTSEALLSDMAGNEPANFGNMSMGDLELWQAERNFAAQRGLIADEMSGTLAGAGKDNNAGLADTRSERATSRHLRVTAYTGIESVDDSRGFGLDIG